MKPAPTIPTLIGVPARSSRSSSRSTMNMRRLHQVGGLDESGLFGHKIGPATVLLGDHGRLCGPLDAERRIVPAHAALGDRRVKLGNEISDLGLVLKSQKGIGAALRDQQHAVIRVTELDG